LVCRGWSVGVNALERVVNSTVQVVIWVLPYFIVCV